MLPNGTVDFRVGDFTISMETYDGQVVEISARDSKDVPSGVDFAFIPQPGGGDCMICTLDGRVTKCHSVPCGILAAPESAAD